MKGPSILCLSLAATSALLSIGGTADAPATVVLPTQPSTRSSRREEHSFESYATGGAPSQDGTDGIQFGAMEPGPPDPLSVPKHHIFMPCTD
jgi:hypothetical protein